MHSRSRIRFAAACTIAACSGPAGDGPCRDVVTVSALPQQLDEASGVAISRVHDNVLWLHNDSEGSPLLYALDYGGRLIAEIAVSAAGTQSDWEDIASGPCPAGHCLYIGDTGDNYHDRVDRAILRIAEPDTSAADAGVVERFPFAYPDGPRDAEAIFVLPDTSVFIISKGRQGAVTIFRYPLPLRQGTRVVLVPVQTLSDGLVQLPELVTGAAAAHDGRAIAIRTYSTLQLYHFDDDTLAPVWPRPGFDIGRLGEPQGEGVALAADGTVYLVSERGPDQRHAPLSRLQCRVP